MLCFMSITLQISTTSFSVLSSAGDTSYSVDTLAGCCSCKLGKTGGPCKHQAAVVKFYNTSTLNFVPIHSPELRMLLFKIATGKYIYIYNVSTS